jgi:hypothetical protein
MEITEQEWPGRYSAFQGHRRLAQGDLAAVLAAVAGRSGPALA